MTYNERNTYKPPSIKYKHYGEGDPTPSRSGVQPEEQEEKAVFDVLTEYSPLTGGSDPAEHLKFWIMNMKELFGVMDEFSGEIGLLGDKQAPLIGAANTLTKIQEIFEAAVSPSESLTHTEVLDRKKATLKALATIPQLNQALREHVIDLDYNLKELEDALLKEVGQGKENKEKMRKALGGCRFAYIYLKNSTEGMIGNMSEEGIEYYDSYNIDVFASINATAAALCAKEIGVDRGSLGHK